MKRSGEHTGFRESIEDAVLVETRHLHQPIDGCAGTADRRSSVRLARDGGDTAIEGRRGTPIDTHLGLAHGAPSIGSRVIEIGVANGAFQLPSPITRQEHDRGMRIDSLDRRTGMGSGRT